MLVMIFTNEIFFILNFIQRLRVGMRGMGFDPRPDSPMWDAVFLAQTIPVVYHLHDDLMQLHETLSK